MKPPIAFPFLRPGSGRISALWTFKPLPNAQWQIPEWDVHTSIAFTAIVNLDHAAVRSDCQLDERAPLALSAIWYSSGTSLRGLCRTTSVKPGVTGPEEFYLSAELAPNDLAGSVEISVVLHLEQTTQRPAALAPRLVGSILWRESKELVLEGSGSRFPIEARNFSADSRLPSSAAWFLDWEADAPTEPLLGTVRLLLNDGHPAIHAYLREETGTPLHESISSYIKLDVADQMIGGMLRSSDFIECSGAFPMGSVGRHVGELLAMYFPGESVASLATRRAQDEARFRAELQQALAFLGGSKG